MGLGTVELVMEFEDEFQLSIPDEQAALILTAGQAFDFIVRELGTRSRPSANEPCPSARRFRNLRADMHIAFGVPRQAIRLSAMIDQLIPPGSVRASWGEFARARSGKTAVFISPQRRFPAPNTTLRELLRTARRGDYHTDHGDVDTEKVWHKVREIVSAQAGVKIDVIEPDTHFINDLYLD